MSSSSEQERGRQLAYSELQEKTHDADRRRRKSAKIVMILEHFLGLEDLAGLNAVDIGCSTGFTADALRAAGANVLGMDIDQPGLAAARDRFGEDIFFLCADGTEMPLAEGSVDVAVFNQVYEHVVDPDSVLSEIRRVLKDDGVVFFGFGNKYQVMEPHYRLPFLSWIPSKAADRYVAMSGRATDYYERFRSRRGLIAMCEPLHLWDYTYSVLADAPAFLAEDVVPRALRRAPTPFWKSLAPIMPTFLWVGTLGRRSPAGPSTRVAPSRVTS